MKRMVWNNSGRVQVNLNSQLIQHNLITVLERLTYNSNFLHVVFSRLFTCWLTMPSSPKFGTGRKILCPFLIFVWTIVRRKMKGSSFSLLKPSRLFFFFSQQLYALSQPAYIKCTWHSLPDFNEKIAKLKLNYYHNKN